VNSKKKKNYFGPEERRKYIVIFIDDVNMPIKEQYGCQPPIELLRQWLDYGGWYDLDSKEKEFIHLCDITFMVAMGPPSQGRNTVTNRFMRHFNLFYVEPFEKESLNRIFSNILDWYFDNRKLTSDIHNLRDTVVRSTIELYNKIKVSLNKGFEIKEN